MQPVLQDNQQVIGGAKLKSINEAHNNFHIPT
jgi:hypothetical protein